MKSYRNAMKAIRQRLILPRRWHLCWDPDWAIMRMISVWQTHWITTTSRDSRYRPFRDIRDVLSSDMSEKFRWCACREEFIIMKDMICRMLCYRRVWWSWWAQRFYSSPMRQAASSLAWTPVILCWSRIRLQALFLPRCAERMWTSLACVSRIWARYMIRSYSFW